ncbi:hypothetical protein [Caproicibacterium sp. XB1]|uniref:hypothetical protein n=1 Tax=Caproicibacterium sp. XB1 TaxID=3396405 RepID=UPI0039B6F6C0
MAKRSAKDTFILQVPKPEPSYGSRLVRLDNETIIKVLDVKQRTGIAMNEIIAKCVGFALDRLVIERIGDD